MPRYDPTGRRYRLNIPTGLSIPGVDPQLLVRDATKRMPDLTRRRFLRGTGTLGALVLLTGCDVVDGNAAEALLRRISRFNDKVQALLFSPNRLAPTYDASRIARPFPFNAFYGPEDAFDGRTLPREYGFPMKVRVPTKLGFKNPKHVNEIFVTNDYPGGFWEDQGYNWFSGL